MGRKGKPKVELTDETIRKLPAAAVIEKHRSLRVLLKKGLNEGKIQSDALLKILNTINLDEESEAEVYGAIDTLGIPISTSEEENPSEDGQGPPEAELADDLIPKADDFPLDDSAAYFFHEMAEIPRMTREETLEMAKRVEAGKAAEAELQEKGDSLTGDERSSLDKIIKKAKAAKDRMIESNIRLVVSIARKYAPSTASMTILDLEQEGVFGLMKAVDRFDYKKGFQFSTYATWWVRQAITRAMADQDKCVRIPVHMVDTITKVQKITKSHEKSLQDIDEEALAIHIAGGEDRWSELGPRQKKKYRDKIHEAIRLSKNSEPVSLDQPVGDEETADTVVGDFIRDTNTNISPEVVTDRLLLYERLDALLMTLPARESKVIRLRFGMEDGKPRTLEEIGREFRLTRERIRQIEAKAMKRLKSPYISKHLGSDAEDILGTYEEPPDHFEELDWSDLDDSKF